MNKIKCENKMKELGVWYDLNIGDDGYQLCIYPTKDKHWFPLIGVHSTWLDKMGHFEFKPKMKNTSIRGPRRKLGIFFKFWFLWA